MLALCYGGDDEAGGEYRYIIFILLYYQITIAIISHIMHASDLRMEHKLDNTFIQKKFWPNIALHKNASLQ